MKIGKQIEGQKKKKKDFKQLMLNCPGQTPECTAYSVKTKDKHCTSLWKVAISHDNALLITGQSGASKPKLQE